MIEWRCLVLSPEGGRDWRRVHALDERQAASLLMEEGLVALDVRTGAKSLSEILATPVALGGAISVGDQALFLTQMAMLLRAGMPVDRSLDLLRDQMPKAAQRNWLAEVLIRVRGGEGLARSLECRSVFPAHVIGVIAAAERSGKLDRAFAMLAERMGELATARRELATALAYPAAVLVATVLALTLVVTVVIPQFEPLFIGEEERLPALTQLVLSFSQTMRAFGLLILLAIAAVPLLFVLWARSPMSAGLSVTTRQRIPGMALRDQYLAARFATVLGTLLDNGVTIVRALPLVASALSSRRWRVWCAQVEQSLREGQGIATALGQGGLMPSSAVRLAEVGERGGRLGEALGEAGRIMHASAKAKVDRFVALANPVAIMTLGGLVALLVGGVMLGIFALGDFAG